MLYDEDELLELADEASEHINAALDAISKITRDSGKEKGGVIFLDLITQVLDEEELADAWNYAMGRLALHVMAEDDSPAFLN